MTPPAVAPAAPVSAPQTAAPPGGGPPNGSSPGGGLFGEILDSARTAAAEGQKETGTNTGDHSGKSKPSSAGDQPSQTATGAELIAAALSVLTGQKPADPAPSGPGKGTATTAADATRPAATSASGAPGVAGSSTAGSSTAGSSAGAAAVAATTATPAKAVAGVSVATPAAHVGAAAEAHAGGAPATATATATAKDGAQPNPGAHADAPATPPVITGAYKPKPGSAPAQPQTAATTAAADAGSQPGGVSPSGGQTQTAAQGRADAAGQTTTAQQSIEPRPQQVPGRPVTDAARVATATAAAPSSSAAGVRPQAQVPTATAATSPAPAQAAANGHAEHPGAGSDGHPASSGQPGAGSAAPVPGSPTGAQTANVFSVPTQVAGGSTAAAQHAARLPEGLVRTSVGLQEAVDAVKATFTAANHAGVSSARISLAPESLGGIKISLAQTPDGLIARVAADHPEAAQALQQSAADLRRTLEASGTTLLRLDIGSSGQQSLGGFAGSQGDPSAARNWTGPGSTGAGEAAPSTPTELTVELPNGSLVNVLA